MEKPLALDVPTAERICAQIRNCGVPTATGYHWRYLDTVEAARALLAERPPRLLVGYWLDCTPGGEWWIHQARSGGQLTEQQLTVDDGTERWTAQASQDPLVCEDRDFTDAVRGKACRIRAPYPEALRTHRVAVAAARAAREGSTVEIPAEDGDV